RRTLTTFFAMPFSARVFCRDSATPSLSDLLVWMRQQDEPATISGGASAGDLLSSFWHEVVLTYDAREAPFTVRCVRADAAGGERLRAEVADFVADVSELPPS